MSRDHEDIATSYERTETIAGLHSAIGALINFTLESLDLIDSQFAFIERAQTLADQKAGCQQLSAVILSTQVQMQITMLSTARARYTGEWYELIRRHSDRLNQLRRALAEFGIPEKGE